MVTQKHKFNKIDDITLHNLKFHPIIAQPGLYTCNAAQVITEYLKPFCSGNKYIIRNMQEFPKMLHQQEPGSPNEEYVSYDTKSQRINVPIQEAIDYIIDGIYVKNKLPNIYSS